MRDPEDGDLDIDELVAMHEAGMSTPDYVDQFLEEFDD